MPGMTRAMIVSCAFVGALSAQTPHLDTVKLLWENEYVRVFEIHVAPGVSEPRHSHGRGVTIALTEYDNETTPYPAGNPGRRHTKFGEVRWAEPVTHEARNVGKTDQRVIRIELKRDPPPAAAAKSPDPLDSVVVAKATQKLIFENAYLRAIEERVPPGVGQPKHRHGQGVLIPLADAEVESVDDPGGQPVRRSLKFGDAGWRQPVVHTVKNVGRTELLNVRIELK
jgi:hypothetical protein